jgi:hypothetical protein
MLPRQMESWWIFLMKGTKTGTFSHYDDVTHFSNRFRKMPPFSQAIRKFTNNVSELKKLAARDYEDLLQVT